MKKGILCILVTLFTCLLSAQDISLRTAFDTTRIYIGDQINFTVTVEQPSGMELGIPAFSDTLVNKIEILSGPDTDSVAIGNDRLRITEKYLVTSFDSGFYEVAPVFIEVKNPDGLKRFYSDYSRIEVMKYRVAPADTTAKFYDIVDPYRIPVTFREILSWALLGIGLAAIIASIVIYARKRRRITHEQEVVVNPDPAHIIAFRQLEGLKAEELWQKGQYKEYHSRLTGILRHYLEKRYHVYSLELTTSETLYELRRKGFKKDDNYRRLERILTFADLIKFAKHVPLADENEYLFNEAWTFVDATREIPEPPQDEKKEGGV